MKTQDNLSHSAPDLMTNWQERGREAGREGGTVFKNSVYSLGLNICHLMCLSFDPRPPKENSEKSISPQWEPASFRNHIQDPLFVLFGIQFLCPARKTASSDAENG